MGLKPKEFYETYAPKNVTGQQFLARRKNYQIYIENLSTGDRVSFHAFITNFKDTYAVGWDKTSVYGRNDPIMTYQGTTRTLQIGWDVPANDPFEAELNMTRIQKLSSMLYPVYEDFGGGAMAIKSPPLMSVKLLNWAQDVTPGSRLQGAGKHTNMGLVGAIDGVSFEPKMGSQAFVESQQADLTGFSVQEELFPTTYSVSINMTVLHTHELGYFTKGGKVFKYNNRFPYNSPYDQFPSMQDANKIKDTKAVVESRSTVDKPGTKAKNSRVKGALQKRTGQKLGKSLVAKKKRIINAKQAIAMVDAAKNL